MELEFRTAKSEGILAAVSNQDGRHALALQLHDGQVSEASVISANSGVPGSNLGRVRFFLVI